MKKNEKKLLLIIILIGIIIIGVLLLLTKNKTKGVSTDISKTNTNYVETDATGTQINKSEKANETKIVNGLTISNVKITAKNGQTKLTAYVTNTSGAKTENSPIEIVMYDKAGKEIGRIPAAITAMEEDETVQIQAEINQNYVNAYDYKIEKK